MKSVIALAVCSATLLAGCSTLPESTNNSNETTVNVVASTDVYGDIAAQVGGDLISVTSLIDGAARDPHSFEASARDQLAVLKADVILANGGGYDNFIDVLVSASESDAVVLSASEIVGLAEGENEHLWYDFDAMDAVAREFTNTLAGLDAANAAAYEVNYELFSENLSALAESLPLTDSSRVAMTEPVPLYLLERAGLVNVTPDSFTEAIEEGADVPPLALQQTLALFERGDLVLLAYNSQTASPETERVREAAVAAGIPVVDFTETLPEGESYLSWMATNIAILGDAL